jgi:hypothetical protein
MSYLGAWGVRRDERELLPLRGACVFGDVVARAVSPGGWAVGIEINMPRRSAIASKLN